MPTKLKNRTLFADGTLLVSPDGVPSLLLQGVPLDKIRVTQVDDEVCQFNQISDNEIQTGAPESENVNLAWNIPPEYASLDVRAYVSTKLDERGLSKDERYVGRVEAEMRQIESRKLVDLVRCLIYIVDRFRDTATIWGVGRGSSCASLVLFLIGIHCVDPIRFNIPLEEFFHD